MSRRDNLLPTKLTKFHERSGWHIPRGISLVSFRVFRGPMPCAWIALRACLAKPSPVPCSMAVAQTPLLSPPQRKLVGFALSAAAFAGMAWLLYELLAGVSQFISTFSSVIWPLAVAGILALVLRPVVGVFESRLKIRRVSAVILLYAVFLLLVAAVLFTFAPAVILAGPRLCRLPAGAVAEHRHLGRAPFPRLAGLYPALPGQSRGEERPRRPDRAGAGSPRPPGPLADGRRRRPGRLLQFCRVTGGHPGLFVLLPALER